MEQLTFSASFRVYELVRKVNRMIWKIRDCIVDTLGSEFSWMYIYGARGMLTAFTA